MTAQVRRNSIPTLLFLAAALATSVALSACAPGTASGPGGGGGDDDPPGGDDDPQCEGPLGPPRDPAALPACCQENLGNGHCLATADVPAQFQQYVGACDTGGFCVPDKFIATGGVYTPPPCASLDGAPGVCLSVCIPQVAQYFAILPQDVCDADERCAPCISPIDMTNTGACDIVGECVDPGNPQDPPPPPGDGDDPSTCIHEGNDVIDPAALEACAPDAHCLQKALVPADFQDRLGPCVDATKLCVPDVFLRTGGDFIAPTCRSLLDAEGRCLSRALPDVKAQEGMLPQSTCTADERCVPCYSPLDSSDTGACRLSCDLGPTEPAKALPACCEGRATCVPNMSVPKEMQANLGQDSCEDVTPDAFLCVPNELLDPGYVPPACTANSFLFGEYTGVCLSDCLDFGIQGLALSGGDCDDGNKCAPCTNPLSGEPTGAPGCPAP